MSGLTLKLMMFKTAKGTWSSLQLAEDGNTYSPVPDDAQVSFPVELTGLTEYAMNRFQNSCVDVDETNKTATWNWTKFWEITPAEPTESEIKLDEVYNNRRRAYPEIGDQLDSLYHAGAFSAEMTAKIKAVKDKYPKS
jgi:hypothetical protein